MTAARRPTQTRRASVADARAYLAKAREFLRAAEDALALSNRVAATGNAVHAGIAAADVITSARAAVVWKGEHSQAPAHLEKVAGSDGKKAALHLRRLVPMKNRAEYDPDPADRLDRMSRRSEKARSADSKAHPGSIEGIIQIYEGTNQIERVVIAKRLLG
jgi:hypothetical protein